MIQILDCHSLSLQFCTKQIVNLQKKLTHNQVFITHPEFKTLLFIMILANEDREEYTIQLD